jgi:hypothetical protein
MLGRIVAIVVALPVVYFGLMIGASELAEEVVVLHTTDERGRDHRTSLWVVEDELETLWLRAGMPDSSWLQRIEAYPEVELERAGQRAAFTAVPVPEARDRIHQLMRERYGLADQIIGALRDGSESVPVRLDERPVGHRQDR